MKHLFFFAKVSCHGEKKKEVSQQRQFNHQFRGGLDEKQQQKKAMLAGMY